MRNNAKRVAMRKLASSNIFNFSQIAVKKMSHEYGKNVIFEKHFKNISLREINNIIKNTTNRINARLNGLALGGHISTQPAYPSAIGSKKFFLVENINEQGEFELGSPGFLYFKIETKNLSPKDLDELLSLGLEINKWENHIKKG